ncbi:MAG: hypothetical protein A2521_13680 [Deltaproteobacteria bacterium RIFOXYD12_FULL_57_12]|nr:MAG: hypothetical protein A2521_13680 [Deltaproteobacteria bacterium RIFOXYD12_FULL_57_12]
MHPLEYTYKGLLITNVYQRLDAVQRRAIIEFWVGSRVLRPDAAQRRVDQVVFTMRTPDNQLAGVNTVYPDTLPATGGIYYFMRMFIRPTDRGVFGLTSFVSNLTREFLKTYEEPDVHPRGMIIVTENPKYWRKGGRRFLARRGWNYFDKTPQGSEIWYVNFDGSLLERSGLSE